MESLAALGILAIVYFVSQGVTKCRKLVHKKLICDHVWAYPLHACQKGCGATTGQFESLDNGGIETHYTEPLKKIEYLGPGWEQETGFMPLHQFLLQQPQANVVSRGINGPGWYCCKTHYPHENEYWKDISWKIFNSVSCQGKIVSSTKQIRIVNYINDKPISVSLPLYKFSVYFGPGGLIHCAERQLVNSVNE
jgi:hypothetical protein